MAWLTTGDLTARIKSTVLLDLADDDGNSVADPAALAAALNDAEGIVEAHLAGRYQLPLVAEKVLIEIGTSIAIHRLYLRKNADSPVHVKETYVAALVTLDRITRGEIGLAISAPLAGRPKTTASAEDRDFNCETLEPF